MAQFTGPHQFQMESWIGCAPGHAGNRHRRGASDESGRSNAERAGDHLRRDTSTSTRVLIDFKIARDRGVVEVTG